MELVENMLKGDSRSLARLITLVENRTEDLPRIMKAIHPHGGKSYVVGLTGPPGAGKSTVADGLVRLWRDENYRVGAVLVDPSSPFSGGAILGDRIRMNSHATDPGVFMRSMASRGSRGGLARSTKEVVHLIDAFGVDWLLAETVGVGQTELDVMSIADTIIVVLGPESGDTVQTMKAGLMEIADIFVINKADKEGAKRMAAEISAMLELKEDYPEGWKPPVLMSIASRGEGIDEINTTIARHRAHHLKCPPEQSRRRRIRRSELFAVLEYHFRTRLEDSFEAEPFSGYVRQVEEGKMSPYEVLDRMLRENSFADIFKK